MGKNGNLIGGYGMNYWDYDLDDASTYVFQERITTLTEDIVDKMLGTRQVRVLLLPDSIKIIKDRAFHGRKSLQKVLFLDENGKVVAGNVEAIDCFAFEDTHVLEFLYPQTLKYVGSFAFSNTPLNRFECVNHNFRMAESKIEKIGIGCFDNTKLSSFVYSQSLETFSECFYGTSISSILCKDGYGNIVPSKFTVYMRAGYGNNYSNLEELSWNSEYSTCDFAGVRLNHLFLEDHQSIPDIFAYCLHIYGESSLLHMDFSSVLAHCILVFGNITKISHFSYLSCCRNPNGVYFFEDDRPLRYDYSIPDGFGLELPSSFEVLIKTTTSSPVKNFLEVHCPKTIDKQAYQLICVDISSISHHHCMVITGEKFNLFEKQRFKKMTPNSLDIDFCVCDLKVTNSKFLPENISPKQKELNGVTCSIQKMLPFYQEEERKVILQKYDLIVEKYQKSRALEKRSIVNNSCEFGSSNSYNTMILELEALRYSICKNQEAISQIETIRACQKIVQGDMISEIQDEGCLEGIVQSILVEASHYAQLYERKIQAQLKQQLDDFEEKYSRLIRALFSNEKEESVNLEKGSILELKTSFICLLNNLRNDNFRQLVCFEQVLNNQENSNDCDIDSISLKSEYFNYIFLDVFSNNLDVVEKYKSICSICEKKVREKIDQVILDNDSLDDIDLFSMDYLTQTSALLEQCNPTLSLQILKKNKLGEMNEGISLLDNSECFDEVSIEHITVSSSFVQDILKKCQSLIDKNMILDKTREIFATSVESLENALSFEEAEGIMKHHYKELAGILLMIGELEQYYQEDVVVRKLMI